MPSFDKESAKKIADTVRKIRNQSTRTNEEGLDIGGGVVLMRGTITGTLARGTLDEPESGSFIPYYWNPDSEVYEVGTGEITIYDTGTISESDTPLPADRQVTIAMISGSWVVVDYADRSGGGTYYGKLQSVLNPNGYATIIVYDPITGDGVDPPQEKTVYNNSGQTIATDTFITARAIIGADTLIAEIRTSIVARSISIVPVSSVSQLIEAIVLTYDSDTQQPALTSEHIFILWLGSNSIAVAANSQLYANWDVTINQWVLISIKCN